MGGGLGGYLSGKLDVGSLDGRGGFGLGVRGCAWV